MKRREQQGVALVVTLILLAVITMIVVAFLAVSQRNRGLTSTATDQINSQFMADAGLERAQAEVAARLLSQPDIAPVQDMAAIISGYNEAVGGVNDDTQGYHETITQVYIAGVKAHLAEVGTALPLHEAVNTLLLSPRGRRVDEILEERHAAGQHLGARRQRFLLLGCRWLRR